VKLTIFTELKSWRDLARWPPEESIMPAFGPPDRARPRRPTGRAEIIIGGAQAGRPSSSWK
jgi:hypothetical protein